MQEKLAVYLKQNLEKDKKIFMKQKKLFLEEETYLGSYSKVDDFIDENKNENDFQRLLFNYIDERNLKDSEVYNKVNIDRRLFSKIRNDKNYHPSKETVILLAVALNLDENDLENLLLSASYSLPKNNYFDLIIRFCFKEKIFDLHKINEFLDNYNCKLLI